MYRALLAKSATQLRTALLKGFYGGVIFVHITVADEADCLFEGEEPRTL